MRKKRKINPLKWIGYLFTPIQKNGVFFVFMFALGWICTQMEIMPYYLRNKGPNLTNSPCQAVPRYLRGLRPAHAYPSKSTHLGESSALCLLLWVGIS